MRIKKKIGYSVRKYESDPWGTKANLMLFIFCQLLSIVFVMCFVFSLFSKDMFSLTLTDIRTFDRECAKSACFYLQLMIKERFFFVMGHSRNWKTKKLSRHKNKMYALYLRYFQYTILWKPNTGIAKKQQQHHIICLLLL